MTLAYINALINWQGAMLGAGPIPLMSTVDLNEAAVNPDVAKEWIKLLEMVANSTEQAISICPWFLNLPGMLSHVRTARRYAEEHVALLEQGRGEPTRIAFIRSLLGWQNAAIASLPCGLVPQAVLSDAAEDPEEAKVWVESIRTVARCIEEELATNPAYRERGNGEAVLKGVRDALRHAEEHLASLAQRKRS